MDKKAVVARLLFLIIIIIVIFIGFNGFYYYEEKQGSNREAAEFCESLGYEVVNEISFFHSMSCINYEDNVRYVYIVVEAATKPGEVYDKENKFYLSEINR